MYPRIPWKVVTDPLCSVEHTLETAGLGVLRASYCVPWLRRLVAVLSSRLLISVSCWCEVCGEQSGTGAGFSPSASVFYYHYHVTIARYTWACTCHYYRTEFGERGLEKTHNRHDPRGDVGVSDAVRRNNGCGRGHRAAIGGSKTRSCYNALTSLSTFRVANSAEVLIVRMFWGWVGESRLLGGGFLMWEGAFFYTRRCSALCLRI